MNVINHSDRGVQYLFIGYVLSFEFEKRYSDNLTLSGIAA